MAYLLASNSTRSSQTGTRPSVTSYDSGYEYSLDRLVDLRLMLRDADNAEDVPAIFAAAS